MNSMKSFYVTSHIDELLAEAAANRLAKSAHDNEAPRRTVASALKNAWSTLTGPVESPAPLPKLTDYPYRS